MGEMADSFLDDVVMESEDDYSDYNYRSLHVSTTNTNERRTKTSPEGTASYPHVHAPSLNKLKKSAQHPGGTPEYSVRMIFDPGTDMSEMVNECERALLEKFKKRPPGPPGLKAWRDAGYKTPIKRCEDYAAAHDGEYAGGMGPGKLYVDFRSEVKPKVVDENVQPIMEPGKVYGGCKAQVSYQAYAYDTAGNKGVNVGLRNFQWRGDGERLGGGSSDPEEDFKPANRGVETPPSESLV